MNEPEPKSILASLSGKPTTASNAGSPTERKTRTILVARTIADEPVKATPTAPCGDGHNSTTAFIVNQHHSRDARSGKLASYAALGGAEDVERFDQFLAEQRGQPSASELRAATTSPHHVGASLKRKTMGHVQLEGIDGKLHDTCQPASTDAATLKLIQQELENDALKRREQVVGNRKWLNSLPIHERVAQQRQQNALRKWRQMSCDWETFKAQAARRLGKAPQELVMSRTSTYREQREMYDVLQKARPLNDKVGEDVWLVSLRNEGTRYVPVGNIFSGLFCPIRESTKLGPRVRRPLDYQEHRLHDTSRPMSKLEKRSLDLLARKKWRLRRQLELLEPHEVDRSSTSLLVVQTTDLFAWASGATNEPNIDDEDNAFVGAFSAGVDETPHGQRHCSNAEPISPMPTTKEENQFMGPSLQITHVADGDEVLGSIPENDGILVGNSPEVCILPLRLSFYTVVGEQEQRSVAITNDGNTIVHYQWWRAPFEDGNAELTMHMRGHRTRKEEQELERLWTTSVSKLWGTLLPQETKQFVFTFESSKAGMFLERWLLDADPQPRIRLGMAGVDPDPDTESSVDLPLEVRLSCVAEDNFVGWSKRKIQLASIDEKESHFFVTNLVDEILDGVRPPEPVVFNELTPREDVTKFYELNGSNEFSDVYFSPNLVCDCHALYQHAQGILKALSSVPVPVVEERKVEDATSDVEKPNEIGPVEQDDSAGDLGRDTEMQQETPKSSPTPTYLVDEWNWRLETLRELCKMADEAQNTQVARLIQQLKMEIDKVEEEEENEEDDEDDEAEEEEKDEEEEEEEDEGMENGDCNVEKSPTLCPRNVRRSERLARRKATEDEVSALQSKLQESFDMMRFSAYTAPYKSARLQERMRERIGTLCGETPVVCDIAKSLNADRSLSVAQAAKIDGVERLLTRAIDEAVSGDQDHQALFEQERRRIQNMWLGDKAPYMLIRQWIAKETPLTNLLTHIASPAEGTGTDTPPTAQKPENFDKSGVILMQIDLDLAPWFSLVKTHSTTSLDETSPKIELAWRFSQELAQHATFVPAKVVQAAESLEKLLNVVSAAESAVHTILLVSELSRPPLTSQMHKLLRSAAQTELKVIATTRAIGESEEEKTRGGEKQNESAEAATMRSLLQSLSLELSLQSIAPIMQRAIKKEVVFCSTIEGVQVQIDISRKKLLSNSLASLDQIEQEAVSKQVEVDGDLQRKRQSPRILLLEHLDVAGVLMLDAIRQRELAASKPATPAPLETQKPAVGGKKPSVSVPTKGKPGTQGIPATPTPAPPAETPPPTIHDILKLEFVGKDFREQGFVTLRNMLTRMVSACILDGIPSQPCESIFAFAPEKDEFRSLPPTFAGPTLSKEIDMWSQSLQPALPSTVQPRIMTAVVGGKCLESKLRLIDGLLEFVREIYFVGEVAMSLYRILHTKQISKVITHSHVIRKHEEKNGELEEDADVPSISDGQKEEAVEKEASKATKEKKSGGLTPSRAHLTGMWDLLVPAVEILQRKARRKCVQLLLPIDLIVGETSLEEQDLTATAVEDDDDDDEDEVEEETDEEEDDVGKKSRKRKASEKKSARQKRLEEPDHADVFEQKHRVVYEGERAHVIISHASSRWTASPERGWQSFQDVTAQCLAEARVTQGKPSVLDSLWPETEADDADEEGEDGSIHKPSPARFKHEWTFRAFDIGPIAMEALSKQLKQGSASENQDPFTDISAQPRGLIINGVCGAVEFHEFCTATKQLLHILQDYTPSEVFIAGGATASWLRQLETEQLTHGATGDEKTMLDANISTGIEIPVVPTRARKVIDDRTMRNARVLKQIVAAKPNPVLANLVSSDSI